MQFPRSVSGFACWRILWSLLRIVRFCIVSAPRRFCAPSFLRPVVSAPRRFCAPSFLLVMATLAASLLLSLQALPAEAGYYSVAYSGGSIACVGGVKSPFTVGSGYCASASIPYTGRGVSGNSISVPDPKSSSPIAAAFTWTHIKNQDGTTPTDATDPPPSCAIVYQSATVVWRTQEEQTTTGFADAGQTSSTRASTTAGQGQGVNFQSQGGSYSVGAGGDSFSVTAKPGPSASLSGSSGDVTIQYSASASPVTIIPNGAKQDSTTGAYSLLTGQHVSTGLTGVPFTPGKGSTYQWSAGGDTFYTYNEKAPSHQLVLLSDDPSYTTSAGFSFYDKSAESVTITCKAVLVCPDGTSLTLNPSSQPINVLKPTASWSAYATAPFVNASGGYGVNEYWQPITISVPTPFSGGLGCFAQLIKPSRQASRSFSAGTPMVYAATYYDKIPDGKGGWMLPSNGLDTNFPYPFVTGGNSDGSWPVSSAVTSGDMPTAPYNPPAVSGDAGGTNWYTATTQDSFTTWLMYQPAGGVWVPLQQLVWSTNITVTNAGGPWAVSNGSAATTAKTGTDTKAPPGWTSVNNASQAQMRP